MKKAITLAGLVLCTTGGFAAENRNDRMAEGKKRNEEAYERMLEQTGWKNEKAARDQKPVNQNSRELHPQSSQPKSS